MTQDLHALAGAYVMDALDADEREAFEAFLATSPATAEEVASLREAVALLGAAAAETPPTSLKASVLDQVDRTRQLSPLPGQVPPEPLEDHAPLPANVIPLRRSSWTATAAMAAAAAAVLVAVGLGGLVLRLNDRIEALEGANGEIAVVLADPGSIRVETMLPGGGTVSAVMSPAHGSAVAVADGLSELSEDEMYALWALVDGGPIPVGELHNDVPITAHAPGMSGLALTVEPRGELTLPTGEIQASLTA